MKTGRYVVLCYRRVGTTELSSGSLYVAEEDDQTRNSIGEVLETFENLSFKDMINKFSSWLCDYPDCQAVMQRVDRPGLVPVLLGEVSTRLLREDPITAIRSMDVSDARIDLRVPRPAIKADPVPTVVPVFRAGHDALAHVFGRTLYARRRNSEVECPGCGMWSVHLDDDPLFACHKTCTTTIAVSDTVEGWAMFHIEDLLEGTWLTRFYFPRDWNKSSWITREELEVKYTSFLLDMKKAQKETET
jgi:hypothetical protein